MSLGRKIRYRLEWLGMIISVGSAPALVLHHLSMGFRATRSALRRGPDQHHRAHRIKRSEAALGNQPSPD